MNGSLVTSWLKACDALARATKTSRHAQKLSAAAAEAFGNETSVFAEVKGLFVALKSLT